MSEPYANAKIGRNAPCPCGSGKKYKRCCLELRAPRCVFCRRPAPYRIYLLPGCFDSIASVCEQHERMTERAPSWWKERCADCGRELQLGEGVVLLDPAEFEGLSEAEFADLVERPSTLRIIGTF